MGNILKNLDWSVLTNLLLSALPVLICITLHECAHGVVALKLGDTTARDMGRLSLNPLKHFDVMGFLMMAVAGFGWAKPVPVDMRRFRDPKRGMALTALAGPAANVLIAVAFLFLYGFLWPFLYKSGFGRTVEEMIARTGTISISFAVFNVLPIPPLDGSKVLGAFLPERVYWKLMRYERWGMLLLFVLVFTGALDGTLGRLAGAALDKLWSFAELGNRLGNLI